MGTLVCNLELFLVEGGHSFWVNIKLFAPPLGRTVCGREFFDKAWFSHNQIAHLEVIINDYQMMQITVS